MKQLGILLALVVMVCADLAAGPVTAPTTQPATLTPQAILDTLPAELRPAPAAKTWGDGEGVKVSRWLNPRYVGKTVEMEFVPETILPASPTRGGGRIAIKVSCAAGGHTFQVQGRADFAMSEEQKIAALAASPRKVRIRGQLISCSAGRFSDKEGFLVTMNMKDTVIVDE